jgi:hypothetical protein
MIVLFAAGVVALRKEACSAHFIDKIPCLTNYLASGSGPKFERFLKHAYDLELFAGGN